MWRNERSYTASANLTKVDGPPRDPHGLRLRPAHAQSLAAGSRQPARHPDVRRRRHRHSGLRRRRRLERLRGVPARADEQLQQERPVRGDERPREPVRPLRRGSLAGEREAHAEPRPALRVLPADVARRTAASSCSTYNTFNVRLGGLGGNPKDLGIKVSKTLFAPRLGVAYRLNENTVFRAGYGKTFNPLPWSRPMRGRFPLTIAYSDAGANGFTPYGSIANGIPARRTRTSRAATSRCRAAWTCARPNPDDVKRGATQSWNVFIERRLPLDIARQRRLRRHAHRRAVRRRGT